MGTSESAGPELRVAPVALRELREFLRPFGDLFYRAESRQALGQYVTGLLSAAAHKDCAGIARAVAGASAQNLQYLLTGGGWDADALQRRRVALLVRQATGSDGALLVADTGLPKQGACSVG